MTRTIDRLFELPRGEQTWSNECTKQLTKADIEKAIVQIKQTMNEPLYLKPYPRIMSHKMYLYTIRMERSWSWRFWMGKPVDLSRW